MTFMSASRYSSLYFSGSNSPVLVGEVEVLGRSDLVRPVEGREEHRLAEGIEGGERLAVLDDDFADRRQLLVLEDLLEEVERLAADLVWLQVVGLLDEADVAVFLVGLRELLDLDRADRLERDLLEVLVGDHDVLVRRPLVALHGLAAGDDLLVDRAEDLHLDPREVLLVEHVEAHAVLGFGGQVELDGDRHEPELDGPLPHCSRHGSSSIFPGEWPSGEDRDGNSSAG
jgi:hypothetical protein